MTTQIHRITPDCQPVFDGNPRRCWLWDAEPLLHGTEPNWNSITQNAFNKCDPRLRTGWTHWHPDQPEAPTATPPTERATEGERVPETPALDRFAEQSEVPHVVTVSAEGAAPAVAQGETPRTNRLRDSVLDAFSRFHKGQIYLEDFAEFVRLAFNDAAHIESELNAAEHSNMNHREYIHRLEADRATLRQSFTAAESELAELRLDRERLDWLEKKSKFVVSTMGAHRGYHELPSVAIYYQSGMTGATAGPTMTPSTLRAAIDAARNQQEKAQ